MSDGERTGRRDLLYSGWHRPARIRKHIGSVKAAHLEMIDIDDVESCPTCHRTLALIETKNSSNDPEFFPTYITQQLALEAAIPAFCVCYTCVCGVTGDKHEARDGCDIAEFRVQQIAPERGQSRPMAPSVYAYWLHAFRAHHWQHICARPPIRYQGDRTN